VKLIEEIIEILSNENCNLENALIKTKILLHKMGEKSLLNWINNELNGYENIEDLPSYRKIDCIVLGSFQNYTTQYTNQVLPIMHLTDEQFDFFTKIKYPYSISEIEDISNKENSIYFAIELEYAPLLMKKLDSSFNVINLKREVSKSKFLGILTQIRSRLLDFILDLSEKIPENIPDNEIKLKSKEIDTQEMFRNAIFDGNITINIGDNNNSKNIQIKNNFDNLSLKLKSFKLAPEDIENLKNSIEKDSEISSIDKKEFGKNVKDWLKNISTKTRDKITMDGITEALNEFYGWLS
jgi:hypothetical protein